MNVTALVKLLAVGYITFGLAVTLCRMLARTIRDVNRWERDP